MSDAVVATAPKIELTKSRQRTSTIESFDFVRQTDPMFLVLKSARDSTASLLRRRDACNVSLQVT